MDMEMEMESEDDVDMLDSDRRHEYTYEFQTETTNDTRPIVCKVDQAELSQEHADQIRRSKRLKTGLFITVLFVSLAALGAIVYIIVHFFR